MQSVVEYRRITIEISLTNLSLQRMDDFAILQVHWNPISYEDRALTIFLRDLYIKHWFVLTNIQHLAIRYRLIGWPRILIEEYLKWRELRRWPFNKQSLLLKNSRSFMTHTPLLRPKGRCNQVCQRMSLVLLLTCL